MIGIQTTNEIIKHRALGLSFDSIALATGVSKPTVMKVCNENLEGIADVRGVASIIARKDIATTITERRTAYNRLWHKCFQELMGRDWTTFSNAELMKMMVASERTMTALESNDKTPDDWILPPMGVAKAKTLLDKF